MCSCGCRCVHMQQYVHTQTQTCTAKCVKPQADRLQVHTRQKQRSQSNSSYPHPRSVLTTLHVRVPPPIRPARALSFLSKAAGRERLLLSRVARPCPLRRRARTYRAPPSPFLLNFRQGAGIPAEPPRGDAFSLPSPHFFLFFFLSFVPQ